MAFANKLGNLLKKATSSNPSIYQAIRCMSSSKLFIGGLSYSTNEDSLRDAFASYGQVVEAKIIIDRDSGRSRGFGFITYTSSDEASSAIMAMDGKDLHGRNIRVSTANERTGGFRSGGGDGGYGGGGGGFRGDSYGAGAGGYGGNMGGSYGSGGGGYGGDRGGSYGGGGSGYAPAAGSGGNDTFSGSSFTPAAGNNFAASSFGGDSAFGGNPAGNYGAPAGPTAGDEFSSDTLGANTGGGKNDNFIDDIFKDDEPGTYADKRS